MSHNKGRKEVWGEGVGSGNKRCQEEYYCKVLTCWTFLNKSDKNIGKKIWILVWKGVYPAKHSAV